MHRWSSHRFSVSQLVVLVRGSLHETGDLREDFPLPGTIKFEVDIAVDNEDRDLRVFCLFRVTEPFFVSVVDILEVFQLD